MVANFMESKKLPYILGKNWTTDAFFRETENNINKRKEDGCISVEMECSAMQAVCDFRGLELYYFLTSGDLLDAPEWDERHVEGEYAGTQHDTRHFDIAIELADVYKRQPVERAKYLYKAADLIEERKEEIAKVVAEEVCKEYKSAVSEVVRTAELILSLIHIL